MTEIRVGDCYVAKKVRTGRNESGPWEILMVQNNGRNQPRISISVINVPSKIGTNGIFKITSIRSVAHSNWKRNGTWVPGNVVVKARVKALAQLSEKEIAQMQDVKYDYQPPQFQSLEDFFK